MPPTFSLSVTNSSAVIALDRNALRPYCTPTLSVVELARSVSLTLPQIDTANCAGVHRMPVGLVTGSYTRLLGSLQLFPFTPLALGSGPVVPLTGSSTMIGAKFPGRPTLAKLLTQA